LIKNWSFCQQNLGSFLDVRATNRLSPIVEGRCRQRKESVWFLSVNLCVCLSVCLPVCMSVCLSACLYVCLTVRRANQRGEKKETDFLSDGLPSCLPCLSEEQKRRKRKLCVSFFMPHCLFLSACKGALRKRMEKQGNASQFSPLAVFDALRRDEN